MLTEPFNKLYICNFNDAIKEEDLPNDDLRRVWRCDCTPQRLEQLVDKCLVGNEEPTESNAQQMLCEVIEMTLLFVQHNFTGPFTQQQALHEMLEQKLPADFEAQRQLMENGEELNPNVQLCALLVLAKQSLQRLLQKWPESWVLHWWQQRMVCLHQHALDDLAANLYEQLKLQSDWLLLHLDAVADKEYEALLQLELANGYLQFHRTQRSDELLAALCERLQVTLNVEGLLGVRTKFQQKPLPQLCLKVQQLELAVEHKLPTAVETNGSDELPKLLLHEDDTRLERIRFIEEADNAVMTLPSVLQALVLAKVKQLKRAQPQDRLADEELEPYTKTLLYQLHGPLQLRHAALLLNSLQECGQRRTVERSWKQCEELVKQLSDETKYAVRSRLSYAFASCLMPRWQLQLHLCDLLLSLGMTKSALDIYLQLQSWQQVIECYTRLELRHKAAEIIQQQLALQPTVLLHCLLGDATDDPSCYETAWKFSRETSGKAQAHWGSYYFQRKEYEEALPHLQLSVQINALQEKMWLRLGYAAIMLERWELAVHAYITYTHLEPLGFESWNNLAKALIKLGDKKRAHKVLGESLKCNYNNWKVWDNFMAASVDTGHFEDALNSYSRLSELKERFLDLDVLTVTVQAISKGIPDAKGQSRERLLKKATTLLAQQCIKHGNEPKLWQLAALISPTPLNQSQKLVKAYRAYCSKQQAWATLTHSALEALEICRELCESALASIEEHTPEEKSSINSQLSSARLSAQACVRAVAKEALHDAEVDAALASINPLLEQLTQQLQQRMQQRMQQS